MTAQLAVQHDGRVPDPRRTVLHGAGNHTPSDGPARAGGAHPTSEACSSGGRRVWGAWWKTFVGEGVKEEVTHTPQKSVPPFFIAPVALDHPASKHMYYPLPAGLLTSSGKFIYEYAAV